MPFILFTCERNSKTNWDPKTETYVEVKENYSGRGVLFGSYSQYEVQALGVLATDKKATILQNEVTMIPKIDDEWITALGFFGSFIFNRIQLRLFGNAS